MYIWAISTLTIPIYGGTIVSGDQGVGVFPSFLVFSPVAHPVFSNAGRRVFHPNTRFLLTMPVVG